MMANIIGVASIAAALVMTWIAYRNMARESPAVCATAVVMSLVAAVLLREWIFQ